MNIFYNRTAYKLERKYGRALTQRVLRYMRSVGLYQIEHRSGFSVQTFSTGLFSQLAEFVAWEERNPIQALPGSEA